MGLSVARLQTSYRSWGCKTWVTTSQAVVAIVAAGEQETSNGSSEVEHNCAVYGTLKRLERASGWFRHSLSAAAKVVDCSPTSIVRLRWVENGGGSGVKPACGVCRRNKWFLEAPCGDRKNSSVAAKAADCVTIGVTLLQSSGCS